MSRPSRTGPAWAATNPHEILTGIGSRVARRYLPASTGAARIRVAVVFGGASPEHDVSCASGSAIITALDPDRYDVVPVLICPDGVWSVGTQRPPAGRRDRWSSVVEAMRVLRDVDVVIPALHGPQGEDGTLQGLLATLDVPFVGSGVLASAVGMDKAVAKDVFRAHGLRVADGVVLAGGRGRGVGGGPGAAWPSGVREARPRRVEPGRHPGRLLGRPRPRRSRRLGRFDPKVLVEAAVTGREVDIAVLEHPDGRREAGPPLEITYAAEQSHFSYQAKYGDDQTVFEIPARLDAEQTAELQRIALEVFDLLGCEGLLRVDFLLGDGSGRPVLNEVNTFPGFTTASQFPQIWAAAGMSYPELVDILVQTAIHSASRVTRPGLAPRGVCRHARQTPPCHSGLGGRGGISLACQGNRPPEDSRQAS